MSGAGPGPGRRRRRRPALTQTSGRSVSGPGPTSTTAPGTSSSFQATHASRSTSIARVEAVRVALGELAPSPARPRARPAGSSQSSARSPWSSPSQLLASRSGRSKASAQHSRKNSRSADRRACPAARTASRPVGRCLDVERAVVAQHAVAVAGQEPIHRAAHLARASRGRSRRWTIRGILARRRHAAAGGALLGWPACGERELAAAGITDPRLRASYEACRTLNAAHGKTYYLATLLLPPAKRPYVHALYGFARYADEIVDDLASTLTEQQKADRLQRVGRAASSPTCKARSQRRPGLRAVVDTVQRWDIPVEHFEAFLHSMAMDLTVTEYADLRRPVRVRLRLGRGDRAADGPDPRPARRTPRTSARRTSGWRSSSRTSCATSARTSTAAGVYLPLEDLARFGLTRADLERRVVDDRGAGAARVPDRPGAPAGEQARARHRAAGPGRRPCIEAACVLYCGIVDEVERTGYEVFGAGAVSVAPARWPDRVAPARRPVGRAERLGQARRVPPVPGRACAAHVASAGLVGHGALRGSALTRAQPAGPDRTRCPPGPRGRSPARRRPRSRRPSPAPGTPGPTRSPPSAGSRPW